VIVRVSAAQPPKPDAKKAADSTKAAADANKASEANKKDSKAPPEVTNADGSAKKGAARAWFPVVKVHEDKASEATNIDM